MKSCKRIQETNELRCAFGFGYIDEEAGVGLVQFLIQYFRFKYQVTEYNVENQLCHRTSVRIRFPKQMAMNTRKHFLELISAASL